MADLLADAHIRLLHLRLPADVSRALQSALLRVHIRRGDRRCLRPGVHPGDRGVRPGHVVLHQPGDRDRHLARRGRSQAGMGDAAAEMGLPRRTDRGDGGDRAVLGGGDVRGRRGLLRRGHPLGTRPVDRAPAGHRRRLLRLAGGCGGRVDAERSGSTGDHQRHAAPVGLHLRGVLPSQLCSGVAQHAGQHLPLAPDGRGGQRAVQPGGDTRLSLGRDRGDGCCGECSV